MDTCNTESVFIRLFTACILFIYTISEIDAFNCYSCSYTISGDPTVTFECANQPWNATTGAPVMSCTTAGSYCVTRVIYQRDKKTVSSMDRGCRIPQYLKCGQNCCEENPQTVVCEYQCKGTTSGQSICNSCDVSRAPKDHTCGTAADIKISSILTFLIILAAKVVFWCMNYETLVFCDNFCILYWK